MSAAAPIPLADVASTADARVSSGVAEFDRVLGGGMVRGAVVLLAGEPGIGKSTLMLQVAEGVARSAGPVLVVSGEESPRQLGMRAERLGLESHAVMLLPETDVSVVRATLEAERPAAVIVDSIQTMYCPDTESAPGSPAQVRDSAATLIDAAKREGVPVFLVGHITKDGQVAGPRLLEHLVDTVLYFEGDKRHPYRIVRAAKNRFGSVSELALFEMTDHGLTPVTDPSARLIAERPEGAAGSVVIPVMEGTRPLLVELQALVTASFLPSPRRLATGVEYNRVLQVLAILERHGGPVFADKDVFVSVAGGVRISEPAADLGTALAIASAAADVALDPALVVVGELGLAGEVRFVSQMEARMREAAAMGFARAMVPTDVEAPDGLALTRVSDLRSALTEAGVT